MALRVIVFGSRNYGGYEVIKSRLARLPDGSIVVHGDCNSGADFYADLAADSLGLTTERHPAKWHVHGRAAGPIRNLLMATLGADLAIGFRSRGRSHGTDDMVRQCERAGIPVEKIGDWE